MAPGSATTRRPRVARWIEHAGTPGRPLAGRIRRVDRVMRPVAPSLTAMIGSRRAARRIRPRQWFNLIRLRFVRATHGGAGRVSLRLPQPARLGRRPPPAAIAAGRAPPSRGVDPDTRRRPRLARRRRSSRTGPTSGPCRTARSRPAGSSDAGARRENVSFGTGGGGPRWRRARGGTRRRSGAGRDQGRVSSSPSSLYARATPTRSRSAATDAGIEQRLFAVGCAPRPRRSTSTRSPTTSWTSRPSRGAT